MSTIENVEVTSVNMRPIENKRDMASAAVVEKEKVDLSSVTLWRNGGLVAVVSSFVLGMLVLFVVPAACAFLVGLELVIVGFVLLAGGLALLIALLLSWRKGRSKGQ